MLYMNIKAYAKEVFREVNKSKSKNKFEIFIKEFNKLIEQSKSNESGCPLCSDCSKCYRYRICDFDWKIEN